MRFGTDPAQTAKIQWVWCQDDALDLGRSSPFVSRDWDQWEVWPDLGEVQGATRSYTSVETVSSQDGEGQPCGSGDVWFNGFPGTVPPDFPRNGFGVAACCGGIIAPLGQPTFGLAARPVPYVPPPVGLRIEDGLSPLFAEDGATQLTDG